MGGFAMHQHWWFGKKWVLLQVSVVEPFPLQCPNWTDLRSNLACRATITIKKNKKNATWALRKHRKLWLIETPPVLP